MISTPTQHARHLVALGAIALGLMLLLVVPAMASAQAPAAPAAPSIEETAPDPGAVAEPAPADEATPPAAEEPVATDPAPPPATEPEASTPAPAPVGDAQPAAPVTSDTPAAPAAPEAEATPGTAPALVLPDVPGIPAALKVSAGPERADAPPAVQAPPPAVTPVAAPAAPPDAPVAPAAIAPRPEPAAAAPPPRTDLMLRALGDIGPPVRESLAVGRDPGPGPAGRHDTDEAGNPFASLAAQGGPAPAGSSLLAVLASYVIPGSGLPSTTLLLFVQLAVILAAFYAPRSGIGERLVALGRLGPRHGYRTVLARPG
jgi:hypothetical protein